jgi:iron complex transport system substrate-binding protein
VQAASTAAAATPVLTQAPTEEPDPTLDNAFPRTVTDDEGTEVTIEALPERIVSLTPATTEIVLTMGSEGTLVGGTDSDDYPPEAVDLPDVVQGITVLTEQIIDLEPDLVLAGGNGFTPPAEIQRLRDLGIPVVVVYAATVDDVLADFTLVGEAIGSDDAAADMVEATTTRITDVTSAVEGLDQPRTFYEIGYGPEIYGPAPNSFIEDMVTLAGGDPIVTDDPAVFSIPLEQLVDQDPQVIVLGDAAYGTCPDSVATRPGWDAITAVAEGNLPPVNDLIVTRPGPRIGEGLAELASAIHPEAEIESSPFAEELCAE